MNYSSATVVSEIADTYTQQYPPGTQNNYVVFLKLFVVTETGKELNFPKGVKGL